MPYSHISRADDSDYENDTYTVVTKCNHCAKEFKTRVPGYQLFRYNQGDFAQTAFADMDPADRELHFISGICGTCWDNLMREED